MIKWGEEKPVKTKDKWVTHETEGEREEREIRERERLANAEVARYEAEQKRTERVYATEQRKKKFEYGVKKEVEMREHPIKARLQYGIRESPQTIKRTGGRTLREIKELGREAARGYGTATKVSQESVRKRSRQGRKTPMPGQHRPVTSEASYMNMALASEFSRPLPQEQQPMQKPTMDFFGEKKNMDYFGNGTPKKKQVKYY